MVFLVLLIPVIVLVSALLLERLEYRLQHRTVSGEDVEEFLDKAQPDEVNTFIKEGWTRALSKFRLRRRTSRPTFRQRLFFNGRSKRKNRPSPSRSHHQGGSP